MPILGGLKSAAPDYPSLYKKWEGVAFATEELALRECNRRWERGGVKDRLLSEDNLIRPEKNVTS